jgi:hypothetical protein
MLCSALSTKVNARAGCRISVSLTTTPEFSRPKRFGLGAAYGPKGQNNLAQGVALG